MNTEPIFDWAGFEDTGRYNTTVKLTEEDRLKNKVRILCKEPYAQELYDLYNKHEKPNASFRKDLNEGDVCKVRALTLSYADSRIYAEDLASKVTVSIPFKEYSRDLSELLNEVSTREFFVTIYRVTSSGEYLASERKAASISHRQELFDHLNNNTWFDVKLVKLIKGGYLALYHEVECFVPGSHAAANVVRNFQDLLGKTITVMVDNYDSTNDLFILSYKKYVTQSMPHMVTELKFDKEYHGTLTNTPYDFGAFVEFDGYYTGLVHKSEFENFDLAKKTMRAGDKISVYVKDVTFTKGQYRIVLTLDKDQVSNEKQQWQDLRNRTENNKFRYLIDEKKNSISIDIDGEFFDVSLKRKDLERNLSELPFVKVFKVDPINRSLKFEFVEDSL
jgi:ribosomal protein S1